MDDEPRRTLERLIRNYDSEARIHDYEPERQMIMEENVVLLQQAYKKMYGKEYVIPEHTKE